MTNRIAIDVSGTCIDVAASGDEVDEVIIDVDEAPTDDRRAATV